MGDWNAKQYLRFSKERTLPATDLVHRIELTKPKHILDIGCGPGNSTSELKKRWPKAQVIGIDSSLDMITTASASYPDMEFKLVDAAKDLSTITDRYDIVFSNACLQWIPDHPRIFSEMMDLLNDGGVLAIQIPVNFSEPIHKVIQQVVHKDKWAELLQYNRELDFLSEEEYHDLLAQVTSDFSMWKTIYMHRMPSYDAIMDWYRQTGLRPYLQRLSEENQAKLEAEVLAGIKDEYPLQKNGEIIFRFPRLFMLGCK